MIFVEAILVIVAMVVFIAVIVMLSTGQLSVMSVAAGAVVGVIVWKIWKRLK